MHLSHDYEHAKAPLNVVYAQLKFISARSAQEEAWNHPRAYTTKLAQDIQTETGYQHQPTVSRAKMGELTKLLAIAIPSRMSDPEASMDGGKYI